MKSAHYLSTQVHASSKKFAGFIDGEPVAFLAYRHFQHPHTRNLKMEHRLVVLPIRPAAGRRSGAPSAGRCPARGRSR
ncbi:hypothetical protein HNP84_009618 [Thermocatellispora tengchongensis]|uniref:Uncharacterized protein n=1 Tax=Thermocatellispora tengchongensis TaxID=1073253 RepID=A0A840PEK1_9ACTN|nr:hypothetical protein [Thermocatellispora tengchongensis]